MLTRPHLAPQRSAIPPVARRLLALVLSLGAALAGLASPDHSQVAAAAAELRLEGSVVNPIDPQQQLALAFGQRSHWLQPWRAYSLTPAAAQLRDAVGINFDVEPAAQEVTARVLAANGFRRARYEVGWSSLSYTSPDQLAAPADFDQTLTVLKRHGIRPLILLNANHGIPCPTLYLNITTTAPAQRGDRQLQIDAASAGQVVPGLTGLNVFDAYKAADLLITGVSADGVASLSKPLPRDLPAGSYPAATLRYPPFSHPLHADGSASPAFEATFAAWLAYVKAVTGEALRVLGGQDFDVEIWNELVFGSDFLDINTYYSPAVDGGKGSTIDAILARTVAWIRDASHQVARIGIADGFANTIPWHAGSNSPAGLTAISHHPYPSPLEFPRDATFGGVRPVDALGQTDGWQAADGSWHDSFLPTYTAYFPEYYQSAIQTEHLIRDLSPYTTLIDDVAHGRDTHPAGAPPPGNWLTEINQPPPAGMPADDVRHLQAKASLRSMVSWVGEGLSALYFYSAKGDGGVTNAMVDPAFFSAWAATGQYPGDDAGGPTLLALRRALAAARPSGSLTEQRPLKLSRIDDYSGHYQFAGDGSASHPTLYDRDLIAFFPYQVSDRKWVAGTYVMTRNLAQIYDTTLPNSDPRRYDLPPEVFQLSLSGVRSCDLSVTATDPLASTTVPVRLVSCSVPTAVVEVALTDSPRLLALEERLPAPTTLGAYRALDPVRIRDTRTGIGGPAGKIGPGQSLDVQVAGGSGVAPDAGAAVINLTATAPSAATYLTLYPAGQPRPTASNLNLAPGQTIANLTEVALGAAGKVSVYNDQGYVDVILDLDGWVSRGPVAGSSEGLFVALAAPARVLDTRSGRGRLGPNQALTLPIAGSAGIPPQGAAAVALNLTAVDGSLDSYLAAYPTGGRGGTSRVNFPSGRNVPNRVIVKLGSGGKIDIYNSQGWVDVVVDVSAWYTDGSNSAATGGLYHALRPQRIIDTRPASQVGPYSTPLGPQQTLRPAIAGSGSIANDARALVGNVTITGTTQASFITIYPSDRPLPVASDLNLTAGQTVPALVIVRIAADGTISVFNDSGSVDVIIDVQGWYD